jgi:ornithine carbamoyltransferase
VKRDYLRMNDLSEAEYRALFARAAELKERRARHVVETTLAGRTLICLFEKNSTRTRLSFEAAMFQLGGTVTSISSTDSQISRGETIADTGRVVSRYADAIMFRTHADARLEELARHSRVPVINGLSDGGHPVQVTTDLFTIEERLGSVKGKAVAFMGDGASNMALSWMEAAPLFGFQLRIGAPRGYQPPAAAVDAAGKWVLVTDDPARAAEGVDVLMTDVWTSMGQEKESAQRRKDLDAFQLNAALLARARPGAPVLHCLPAHRGEEITDDVIDGPQSTVWDEAENRMHVQKALLEKLILG